MNNIFNGKSQYKYGPNVFGGDLFEKNEGTTLWKNQGITDNV